ncbi:hypothetical protein EPA93_10955 [Ktedonosporobacter rubrisoli]|uniref:Uncharacterized protein n=1 Tax=Ktedonosporobacter rubrisoli TaxID=2509675 RepID=A0A4P6JN48_KTERU|nr:hypothetical protein [Ktedonosporobacter rubrisoli]QBD76500.1 hypothetical protein EPA93_10955 [Ktedonosporobacter rubrisoli]
MYRGRGKIDLHFAHTPILVAFAYDGKARLMIPTDQVMGRFVPLSLNCKSPIFAPDKETGFS